MFANVPVMFVQLFVEHVDGNGSLGTKPGNIFKCIDGQMETAHLVQHDHIEGRGSCTVIGIAADMKSALVGAPMNHCVNQPTIIVKRENDGSVGGKEFVEGHVVHAMGMIIRTRQTLRSTTLTTRTLMPGTCFCSNHAVAQVSMVGTSPAQAKTTSGSPPRSLVANFHVEAPREQ